MPGITGMATTYDAPNFVGELFETSPSSTPLLSAIGGLTGGVSANGSFIITWQSDDLRDAAKDRQRLEGADAPDPDTRVRAQSNNVLEIHQERVEVSYTKLAATNVSRPVTGNNAVLGDNPVKDELAYQLDRTFKAIARDVETSFINGTYALPGDNTQPRRTRGILEAVSTNVVDAGGAPLDRKLVLDLLQQVWTSGGLQVDETATIVVNATLKRALTDLFVTQANYTEQTRNVGGVNLQLLETDFGKLNVMMNRYMPVDQVAVVSLDHLAPVFLEVPGMGHFFAEPLAKTGSTQSYQVYGEIGLKYGAEQAHGKIIGVSV